MPKRLSILAAALLAAATAFAAHAPQKINFQGKLLDPATNDPRNGAFNMTFRIYGAPSGGSALYTESQNNVPVSNGVFSVQIGTNAALFSELFMNASAYLSVQVSPDGEMSPRQQLLMAPYAFTAAHLMEDDAAVVHVGGTAYSTFTAAGNLLLSAGIQASSAAFVNGLTASSATFLTGGATQYAVTTASGVRVMAGTLRVEGSGGAHVEYGVTLSTARFAGQSTDPAGTPLGTVYFNTSSGTLKIADGFNGWTHIPGSTFQTSARTTDNNAATAAKAAAGTILVTPIYISGPMVVNAMTLRVTTLLGAAGDVGIYTSTGGLALNGGSSSVTTAAAVKSVAPAQSNRFLRPGQYYAAVTWNNTAGVIAGVNMTTAGAVPRCGSVLGGGLVLPATIDPNAITNLQYCYFVGFSQ